MLREGPPRPCSDPPPAPGWDYNLRAMRTLYRCDGSRVTAILALCLAGISSSLAGAQDVGRETLRVCTHPAAGFFVRDANGVGSGIE